MTGQTCAQDLVGVLVGKGGVLLAELQQLTGVHVQLSDRSHYVVGMPQHRTLTLTGTPDGIGCVSKPTDEFIVSSEGPHNSLAHADPLCAQVRAVSDVAAALQRLQHRDSSVHVGAWIPCFSRMCVINHHCYSPRQAHDDISILAYACAAYITRGCRLPAKSLELRICDQSDSPDAPP